MSVNFEAQFEKNKISQDKDYEGNLLVSIRSPEDPNLKRTPINAVLVLDVSGSMSSRCKDNRSKMEAVKDTAAKLVKNLTDSDEIAIITYDSTVNVVQTRVNAGCKEPLLSKIERLSHGSMTNLSGGFLAGVAQVNKEFSGVKRIFLLTDGLPNEGIRDNTQLIQMVKANAETCTVSTFGFGLDADQELLQSLAQAGGGNYYFIENSQDSDESFARELGGIAACKAQNIEVEVDPNGNDIVEVLNDFTVTQDGKKATIKADDIYAGEVKHLLVKVKIGKREKTPKDRPYSVAHVTITYDDLETKKRETVKLNPKVEFVPDAEADQTPVLIVAEQAAILEAANARDKAIELANRGDFTGAQGVLRSSKSALAMCASLGSDMARMFDADTDEVLGNMEACSYNPSYGSKLKADTRGVKRMRATAGGASAKMYSNKSGEAMLQAFADPTKNSPQSAVNQTGTPTVKTHVTTQVTTQVTVQPPVDNSKSGSFSKTKRRTR